MQNLHCERDGKADRQDHFHCQLGPWIKFLLSQVYISIAAGIGDNEAHLMCTNKELCQLLKDAREIAATCHT